MADGFYHLSIRRGSRSQGLLAARKHDYIMRLGDFAKRHEGALAFSESRNMPAWAADNPRQFWTAADEFERANATVYHEVEFALPLQLSFDQQIEAVREFASQICGESHPYSLGLHDNQGNPHVHLMFSGRMLDGVERSAEQFFKRYNSKSPEKGGCKKAASGEARGQEWVQEVRAAWTQVANRHLQKVGAKERIDHRSYADRGIQKTPGKHVGRKAAGMEKRGKVSRRGLKNREIQHLSSQLDHTQKEISKYERHERTGATRRPAARSSNTKHPRHFTAWRNDRPADRPGLRTSRARAVHMPVLRSQSIGQGHKQARDTLLQRTIQGFGGGGDRGLYQSQPEQRVIDCAGDPARRQLFKAKLLQTAYRQQISVELKERLHFVDATRNDQILIRLKTQNGITTITDHGERMAASSDDRVTVISMVQLARAKGWTRLSINPGSTPQFRAALQAEAVAQGLQIIDPSSSTTLKEEKTMSEKQGAAAGMGMMPMPGAAEPEKRQDSTTPAWVVPLSIKLEELNRQAEEYSRRRRELGEAEDLKNVRLNAVLAHADEAARAAFDEFDKLPQPGTQKGVLSFLNRAAEQKTFAAAKARAEAHWNRTCQHPEVVATIKAAKARNDERFQLQQFQIPQTELAIKHARRLLADPAAGDKELRASWARSKAMKTPLPSWQEEVIAPIFKSEEDGRQAELDAAFKQRRELEDSHQAKADALQKQLDAGNLPEDVQQELQQRVKFYQALADGRTPEEAEEISKKSDAPRPR